MANTDLTASHVDCVNKTDFYEAINKLKKNQTNKSSPLTLFLDQTFYDKAKAYLKATTEENLGLASSEKPVLTKREENTLTRKKWKYSNNKLLTSDNKEVVSKDMLYDVLSFCHQRIAHRGREKTQKWLSDNYSEISEKVVNTFVSFCKFHAEQKPITRRVKEVQHPLHSDSFLTLLEVDLMDFRNCPCSCKETHRWSINIIGHHTKFINVHPLRNKTADEVLTSIQNYCFTYGYPKKILTDNGGEFQNSKLKKFCKENGIELAHGAARTPTTQGLVERSNRTFKDIRALIISGTNKETNKWCQYTMQAAYVMNITYHRAIKQTPYEAYLGLNHIGNKCMKIPLRKMHQF